MFACYAGVTLPRMQCKAFHTKVTATVSHFNSLFTFSNRIKSRSCIEKCKCLENLLKKGVHLENITSYKMLSVKAQFVDGLQQKA